MNHLLRFVKPVKSLKFFTLLVLSLSTLSALVDGPSPSPLAPVKAQSGQTNGNFQQGSTVAIAGKTFPINWRQSQAGGQLKTEMSDIGAMQALGLELLDNAQPQSQPLQWFSGVNPVTAQFSAPDRYLDLSDWLQSNGIQTQVQGQTLLLSATGSQILDLREGQQPWGKRLVLTLSRPTYWQVSQAKNEGAVILNAATLPTLPVGNPGDTTPDLTPIDEDDLGGRPANGQNPSSSYRLTSDGMNSKVLLNLPPGYRLQVSTLANPPRLVIDQRPDAPPPKAIAWTEGVLWRQAFVNTGRAQFPVTWLELDWRNPKVQLQPITGNPQGVVGTTPLTTMVRAWQVSAGINGGYFNRKTQFPLGAIKKAGRWLSGPILQRGAIAWDDQGNYAIGRLSLQETITTNTGQRLPVDYLNSGYVQKGLARYTADWGNQYIPATDNEVISTIQGDQITAQQTGGPAGQLAFPIPADGYVLVVRGSTVNPNLFTPGTRLTVQSQTSPSNFASFPHTLGAGPLLIDQGRIVLDAALEKFNPAFQKQTASRSAIAVDRSGKLALIALHNRVGGTGPTLGETAVILQQMGMRSALNLDGGSSTSLALGGQLIDRSPVTAARVNHGLGVFVRP